MKKLLTAKQLSESLQVNISTIYLWTHTQFVPHYKLGKSVRFRESEVQKWLNQRHSKFSKKVVP